MGFWSELMKKMHEIYPTGGVSGSLRVYQCPEPCLGMDHFLSFLHRAANIGPKHLTNTPQWIDIPITGSDPKSYIAPHLLKDEVAVQDILEGVIVEQHVSRLSQQIGKFHEEGIPDDRVKIDDLSKLLLESMRLAKSSPEAKPPEIIKKQSWLSRFKGWIGTGIFIIAAISTIIANWKWCLISC